MYAASLQEKLNKGEHFVLRGHVNKNLVQLLLDGGSEADLVDQDFVRMNQIPTMKLEQPIPLFLADGTKLQDLKEAAIMELALGEHVEQILCYMAKVSKHQVILGDSWLQEHNPAIDFEKRTVTFNSAKCIKQGCLPQGVECMVKACKKKKKKKKKGKKCKNLDIELVDAKTFYQLSLQKDHETFLWVYTGTGKHLAATTTEGIAPDDYDHFMKGKKTYTREELLARVPEKYQSEIAAFMKQEADKLPPHRAEDHQIELIEGAKPPFARNYRPQSVQEQDAVKKYLEEHLGKGFIRNSSSQAAAPILLVKKPGGGIRVCVDYRELNELTVKNRYPIPQIRETLDRISKAKIFTKLDVVAAFNRLRIKEGQEWLTAFNTRYGQFEYLVMPFGLCNAPGTFQSYINETLREYLDNFCTAYLDDILIFSENEEEHSDHVLKILRRLRERGLYLDIDKCEFDVKETRYLGFIITTEGIKMDPEKVKAVQNWAVPETVKQVKGFIGFADFYRIFIEHFSELIRPLTELTRGETFLTKRGKRKIRYREFNWTKECQKAFEKLKIAFTTAPVLAHFDPELETWLETDASDYVVAGVMSQMHGDILRPVAFYSRKLTPAETRYEIHDKELLAIVQAFKQWRPELTSVAKPIKIYTDHLSLQYFMKGQLLNRRQMRWAEILSEFKFKIRYRPGKEGGKPDALSRRAQDMPNGEDAELKSKQEGTLLKDYQVDTKITKSLTTTSIQETQQPETPVVEPEEIIDETASETESIPEESSETGDDNTEPTDLDEAEDNVQDLEQLIEEAYRDDEVVQDVMRAKELDLRRLPKHLLDKGLRLSMADLEVRDRRLWVSNRLYVPDKQPLRHAILELHH